MWDPLEQGFGYQFGACVYRYDSLNKVLGSITETGDGSARLVEGVVLSQVGAWFVR